MFYPSDPYFSCSLDIQLGALLVHFFLSMPTLTCIADGPAGGPSSLYYLRDYFDSAWFFPLVSQLFEVC
jgi:hypothetical protein